MAKQTKTQRINALLASNPELTAKEVAKKLGVTTNLVHQVKWQTKKNSEFVSKVFARAKMKPTPERSDDPKVIAAEDKYVDAVESLYKKPTRLLESVREMKTALDALDKIKDKPKKSMAIQEGNDLANKIFQETYDKYHTDLVNHPPHYTAGGIDFIDFAEAKGLTENAYLFNVVKYVVRAGKKADVDPVQDLEKAEYYLKREIARRKRA
jgi:hypothetical protein